MSVSSQTDCSPKSFLVPIAIRMVLMASLFDRTFERFRRALGRGGDDTEVLPPGFSPDLEDASAIRELIDRSLSQTSAVAARAAAAEIGQIYLALSESGKTRFLTMLAEVYAVRETEVAEAIDRYQAATDPQSREEARFHLQDTLRPPARNLLTLFNGLEIGTKFVVDLRADLRRIPERSAALRELGSTREPRGMRRIPMRGGKGFAHRQMLGTSGVAVAAAIAARSVGPRD